MSNNYQEPPLPDLSLPLWTGNLPILPDADSAIDPICGMTVDRRTAIFTDRDGERVFFCCEHCRAKFLAGPTISPEEVPAGTRFFCPMCPEIETDRPANCPLCGMPLEPDLSSSPAGNFEEEQRWRRRILIASLAAIPVLILAMGPMLGLPLDRLVSPLGNAWIQAGLTTVFTGYAGWPLWLAGWNSLVARRGNMFTLILFGVLSAWGFSLISLMQTSWSGWPAHHGHAMSDGHLPMYFESAAVITVLVLVGQWLELKARQQTQSAIRKLLDLAPTTVHRLSSSGEETAVPLSAVRVGDRLRLRPGERVPVDGRIESGLLCVDESTVTGESLPNEKVADSRVLSGSLNLSGTAVIVADHVGRDTFLARMVQLVSAAQRSRIPIQQQVDRIAAWFVPIVLFVAMLTFIGWLMFGTTDRLAQALTHAVSVLIIACPCALGLATPMSLVVGLGRGAQLGILIREARAIEMLSRISTVILDKTGTLTAGKPTLENLHPQPGFHADELLEWAAVLERGSEHPLGRAIVAAAKERRLAHQDFTPQHAECRDFRSIAGQGVSGEVSGHQVRIGRRDFVASATSAQTWDSVSSAEADAIVTWISVDGQLAGMLGFRDAIKPTSAIAVRELQRSGLRVVLASGDRCSTAERIAEEIGIEKADVHAELSPEEKLQLVMREKASGASVAMAGDGINDAPALAAADVGIAMGPGTDVALHAADVVLVNGDVAKILTAMELSRAVLANLRQNLWLAFAYNGLAIPLAAGVFSPWTGWQLSPMIAAAAMSLSSVSVISNALRLRGFQPRS